LVSNSFSVVYIFLSIITGLLFCYLLLPDATLLAMEDPGSEEDPRTPLKSRDPKYSTSLSYSVIPEYLAPGGNQTSLLVFAPGSTDVLVKEDKYPVVHLLEANLTLLKPAPKATFFTREA
jgi:hypothetical protein